MQQFTDELPLLNALRLAVVATDEDGAITFVNEAATRSYAVDTDQLVGRNVRDLLAADPAGEQRLRLAHEAAELGSWHWDMATGITVWDEQLEAIYGMAPGGFDGTFAAWEATLHPDDHDQVMAIVEDAIAARSSYVLRNRMFWPAGTLRWIEAHGKVTTDAQGNPTGTIGCVRAITERVLVQERESDAAARALLVLEVTAALAGAWTRDQVERVVAEGLERVEKLLHGQVELRVPE